jgi:hypothetical protein
MKFCTKCKTEKPEEEFYKRPEGSKYGLYDSPCKACKAENRKAKRKANMQYVLEYLLKNPCVECRRKGFTGINI